MAAIRINPRALEAAASARFDDERFFAYEAKWASRPAAFRRAVLGWCEGFLRAYDEARDADLARRRSSAPASRPAAIGSLL